MKRYRIFVAYDKHFYGFCSDLIDQLNALPWDEFLSEPPDIWRDSAKRTGNWNTQIREHIANCDALILLMSKRYFGVDYVKREEWSTIKERLSAGPAQFFPILMDRFNYQERPEIDPFRVLPRDDTCDPTQSGEQKPSPRAVKDFTEEQQGQLPMRLACDIFNDIRSSTSDSVSLRNAGPIEWDEHFDPSIPGGGGLIGRERQRTDLDRFIRDDAVAAVALIGKAGMGKSTLIGKWLYDAKKSDRLRSTNVLAYTFTPPVPGGGSTSVEFFSGALMALGVSQGPHTKPTATTDLQYVQNSPIVSKESEIERAHHLIALIETFATERSIGTLVILDGIDVLRRQVGRSGKEFDDPAMRAFITIIRKKGLPRGCKVILSCRFAITELDQGRPDPSGSQDSHRALDYRPIELRRLSDDDSRELLYRGGVLRTFTAEEMDSFIGTNYRYFGGNPLVLGLYAGYVRSAHHGDPFLAGIATGQTAPNYTDDTIQSSACWLADNHPSALWILRSLGLVHRQLQRPEYERLQRSTEKDSDGKCLGDLLPRFNSSDFHSAITQLEEMQLIEDRTTAWSCHALQRDWFAADFEEKEPELWRIGHGVLFEYFKERGVRMQLCQMEPLYRAVIHGCLARRLQDAFDIYWVRIHRGDQAYSTNTLGNHTRDLSALAGFFGRSELSEGPHVKPIKVVNWGLPRDDLADDASERVVGVAAFCLHSVGLVQDSIDARAAQLTVLARRTSLSRSYLTDSLIAEGRLVEAARAAREAYDLTAKFSSSLWAEEVEALSRIGAVEHLMGNLCCAIEHSPDNLCCAKASFLKAENLLADHKREKWERERPRVGDEQRATSKGGPPPALYSLPGSRYWELQITMAKESEELLRIREQVQKIIDWLDQGGHEIDAMGWPITWLLDRPLAALALGRIAWRLDDLEQTGTQLKEAVTGIRRSGQIDQLPSALLARAKWRRCLTEETSLRPTALEDAEEVRDIAQRFGLGLYEVDAWTLLSELHAEANREEDAWHALGEAKQAHQFLTDKSYGRAEVRLHLAEARLKLRAGERDKTEYHLSEALGLIEQRGQWSEWADYLRLREQAGTPTD